MCLKIKNTIAITVLDIILGKRYFYLFYFHYSSSPYHAFKKYTPLYEDKNRISVSKKLNAMCVIW